MSIENGNLKSEITLRDDDSSLVRLMIDYFYQLDYDDTSRTAIADAAIASSSKEPESPVARSVAKFERLSLNSNSAVGEENTIATSPCSEDAISPHRYEESPPLAVEDAYRPVKKSKKGKQGKKRISHWNEDDEENAIYQPEPPRLQLHDEDIDLDCTNLATDAHMYALADKYETDDLKDLARDKFTYAATRNWKSRAFAYAAGLVCETTPKNDMGLRNVVIETVNDHRELLDFEEIQRLLNSGNGLAWGLLKVVCG